MRRLTAVLAAVALGFQTLLSGASPTAAAGVPAAATTLSVANAAVKTNLSTVLVRTKQGQRQVLLSIPSTWPTTGRQVIILIHGAGTSPERMLALTSMNTVAAASGIAVASLRAYPVVGVLPGWNAGSCCYAGVKSRADDVGYVAAAVAMLRTMYRVSARDITIVGSSNGGMLGYRVICERPGLVGALVSVHGARLVGCPGGRANPPTAILELHGDADRTVPYLGMKWQGNLKTALPSSRTSIIGAGVRAGCSTFSAPTKTGMLTTTYGLGCSASVRLVVVHGLAHGWSRGSVIDETAVAVRFALTAGRASHPRLARGASPA